MRAHERTKMSLITKRYFCFNINVSLNLVLCDLFQTFSIIVSNMNIYIDHQKCPCKIMKATKENMLAKVSLRSPLASGTSHRIASTEINRRTGSGNYFRNLVTVEL